MVFLAAQNNGQMTPEQAAGVMAVIVTAAIVGLLITLAINIVISALLYGCFNRIPPQHRTLEPGLVWLLLIPLVPIVWNFFVFQRLPESYQRYFHSIGRTDVGDCGKTIGLWYSIALACSVVPCVNYITFPAALVLLIVFLVKAMSLKNMIAPTSV